MVGSRGGPKRQHLTTLDRAQKKTACPLSVRAPIVAKTDIIKLILALGFQLDHRDDLDTSLHHFGLFQHTSATWNVLKSRSYQHHVIADGGTAPSLEDAATLTTPDGVSLPPTMAMSQGIHVRLRVVLVTLLGKDHPNAMVMRDINAKLLERKTDLYK